MEGLDPGNNRAKNFGIATKARTAVPMALNSLTTLSGLVA
jgi:hypothetical protein